MAVFCNILNVSALTNQLIICSQLKKYEEKTFSTSQTTVFFSKILQQRYLGALVECPRWNIKHLGNCTVLMSQCHSQFIKKVWFRFLQLYNMVRIQSFAFWETNIKFRWLIAPLNWSVHLIFDLWITYRQVRKGLKMNNSVENFHYASFNSVGYLLFKTQVVGASKTLSKCVFYWPK